MTLPPAARELPGRLVLLGHPIAHSLSPIFQNAALRDAGLSLLYDALDVPPARLTRVAEELRAINGAGNVTIPHKETFARLCARRSQVAERVGAVNAFWTEAGELVGDNTDVDGFDAAVRHHFGAPPSHACVAVLGAGGAAAAVLAAVERWDGASVRLVARSRPRAFELADRFANLTTVVPDVREALVGATLIVNATPIGLTGEDMPLDPHLLLQGRQSAGARGNTSSESSDRIGPDILDLTYRRGETPWVHACRAQGLHAADGLAMLIEQGALAYERWLGVAPNRSAMWNAVR